MRPGKWKWLGILISFSLPGFVIAGGLLSLSGEAVSLAHVGQEFLAAQTLHVVQLTLLATAVALGASWVLALPLALFFRMRNSTVLRLGVLLPGIAYALVVLWALRFFGVQEPYSLHSVMLAWILAGTLYLASGWVSLLRDLDPRQNEMLRVLGAGPIRAFVLHEFLRSWPGQLQLLLQQAWFCFTSFSLVLILNGGPPNETLEVAIYSALRLGGGSIERAVALTLWQTLLLLALKGIMQSLSGLSFRGGDRGHPTGEWAISTGVPCGRKGLRSNPRLLVSVFAAGVIGVGVWGGAFSAFRGPLMNSLVLGASVTWVCLLFCISCYFSGLRSLAEAASWTSPMILSFLVWRQWNGMLLPWLNLILLQALLFAPGFSRGVFPVLSRFRRQEWEIAQVLGASPFRAWIEVEWPRVRGPVFRALGMVFSLSFMEVTSVLLLSRGDFETLSSHVQDLFLRFRIDEAAIGTVLLASIVLLTQVLSEEDMQGPRGSRV